MAAIAILSQRPATMTHEAWICYLDRIADKLLGNHSTPQERFERRIIKTPTGGKVRR